ncbi:MarR family winged helix-turn-helix transcriptional regulator [Gordonia sp. ABSL49_1]|uniref:MarR family winged helix-turn-helix transcriptional regulator n=1 Tax=Gordonia sp. ABSL49_1 TaxID=2920941 RepID=UPI001F0EFCCF|nr:MarR family transcriptional regulator [Gordonia sp. ABSL49_1]MCH5642812.1 MarR family transcriptional regulator [Gordonia sp. ABSL49_1]
MTTTDSDKAAPAVTELWFAMNSLVRDYQSGAHARISELTDMPFSRFRALRRIAVKAMPQRELAARLGVDAPAASGIVDDLVSRGLVTREPHPTDRRSRLVTITTDGARIVADVAADPSVAPTMFEALDADGRRELGRLLGLLQQAAEGMSTEGMSTEGISTEGMTTGA